ncbi:delta subunit of the central stalk of mitochondrial F1F0 ATP synthase, atp16 [Phlyctochytrium bullatum]|nr:delta subunit of the central stalk of mitochondrial F1F0 ATP synthase, atp16 [Phlyctochytrium bullatum]
MPSFTPMIRRALGASGAFAARSSFARAPLVSVFTRGYAEAPAAPTAAPGKLLLNFVVPHQPILKNYEAVQVNLSSTEGDMGILADHVPTISQLNPGVIEVIASDKTQKFFVSGGFAVINTDSSLNINAVEAFPIEDLDVEAARRGIEEANRKINASGTSEADKAAAKIELEVFEAVVYAATQK